MQVSIIFTLFSRDPKIARPEVPFDHTGVLEYKALHRLSAHNQREQARGSLHQQRANCIQVGLLSTPICAYQLGSTLKNTRGLSIGANP